MRKVIIIISIIAPLWLCAQEYEWNVDNTGSTPGERIIVVIDAGTVGSYDGIGIVGTVIDNNGNWGYNTPTKANFSCYVKFSAGLNYEIKQDKETKNIILRLRKISDSKIHLTANLPFSHMGARVIYRVVESNGVTASMDSPTIINNSGELLLEAPNYISSYSGNVGIGTTTPDSKLTVAGKVHAQEVKVTITAGADFVFEDSYQPPTLKELESFIKSNKHLPEIASAKEMETEGLELGEMNIKLLQKIEELTLYTIQQQKELELLKAHIKKIKSTK